MKEVDPKETKRALSYQYYINAPMPMVTIFKTTKASYGFVVESNVIERILRI